MKEYISKDSAIVKALKYIKDDADAFDCKEEILQLTAADVRENVKGEWIEIKHTFLDQCSNCGYITKDVTTNYCPDCGADMRGANDD